MDQIKIGKFIADQRKKQNLTQLQLAEQLNITDRAVSKWENGRAMPDSSIMIKLCMILQVSVNDLLSGEKVKVEDYNKELEKNLMEMTKKKEEADKRLLTLEWVLGILSCIILIMPIIIASYVEMADWQRIVIIVCAFIFALVGFCFTVRIEQVAGYYECQHCGHKYVPTFKAVNLAPHMGRTRYMKCPNCNKKSWQKKVISKD